MEYKRFGNKMLVRMFPGEEVLQQVKEVAIKENITLGMINALGATNDFTIGVYSIPEQKYYSTDYQGAYEIVSLHGNISTMNDEVYLHIHMAAGDNEGHFVGGHLNRCIISATCEMFIDIIDGKVDRYKDEQIGINVIKF